MERRWIILIISGALILSTLVIGLLIHASFHRDMCPEKVYQTPECVQAAAYILDYIDTDVSPCDNFYKFACGNFIKSAEISDDMKEISTYTIIHDDLQKQLRIALEEPIEEKEIKPFQLLKTYYQGCIDTEAVERRELSVVHELLKEIGGWPVLEDYSWDNKNLDWYYYIYKFRQLGLNTNHIFKLNVDYDFRNTTFHMLELDQPSFSLPREFLIDDVQNEYVEEYRRYMVNTAVYFGGGEFRAIDELRQSLKFERKLAKISQSHEERSNITNFYNIMSIKDLASEYSTFPWLEYINNLVSPLQVTSNERILVLVPDYIKNLQELLKITPKRVQINYLVWKAMASLIPYLNEGLRTIELKFQGTMSGIDQRAPRWKECVQSTYKSFPVALSALYVRTTFESEAIQYVEEIAKNIKAEYIATLEKVDWIDKKTKQSALDKVSAITTVIGHPDELLVDAKLEEMYEKVQVHRKDYLRSFLNISLMMENMKFQSLRDLKTKTAWIRQGMVAEGDAFYSILTNTIIIPAGIFQGSFSIDHPNYLNYGAMGFIVSQQIAKAFDDTGRQFDKDGNLRNWWGEDTETSYLERIDCFIDHYDNYTVEELNQTVNGMMTLGDNIADYNGIKFSYASYIKWAQKKGEKMLPGLNYTPAQLFWISFALTQCTKQRPEHLKLAITEDVHSPPEFRVIGSLQNLPEFAEDFDCTEESKMYPADTCMFW